MNEIEKYLPTPPQLGPPLPGILKAYWPWVQIPPSPPAVRAAESPGSPSINYMDVSDDLTRRVAEDFRAEQAAKGLVPFVYE